MIGIVAVKDPVSETTGRGEPLSSWRDVRFGSDNYVSIDIVPSDDLELMYWLWFLRTNLAAAPTRSEAEVYSGFGELRSLIEQFEGGKFLRSEALTALAEEALARIAARESEDVERWAQGLTEGPAVWND